MNAYCKIYAIMLQLLVCVPLFSMHKKTHAPQTTRGSYTPVLRATDSSYVSQKTLPVIVIANSKNKTKNTIYLQPTYMHPFFFNTHERVTQWQKDPEHALIAQGYCTHGHKRYAHKKYHPTIIAIHDFDPRVDNYINFGVVSEREKELRISLPGTLQLPTGTLIGNYTYAFAKNKKRKPLLLYHRTFMENKKAHAIRIKKEHAKKAYDDNFPQLSKSRGKGKRRK